MPQAKNKQSKVKESYDLGVLIADMPAPGEQTESPEHEAAESPAYEAAEREGAQEAYEAAAACHDEARVGGAGGAEHSLSEAYGSPEAFAGGGPAGYGDESLEEAVAAPQRAQAASDGPAPRKARSVVSKALSGVQGLQPSFVSKGGQTSMRGLLARLKPSKQTKGGKPSKSGKSGY